MSKQLCHPSCSVCGGLGYVRYDVPVGHPKFGRLEPCPERGNLVRPMFLRSGLQGAEFNLTWNDVWDLGNVLDAVEIVRNVMTRGYGVVFMYGNWGVGKTLVMQIAVATWLRDHKTDASYVNMSNMIDAMREAQFDPDADNQRGDMTHWSNCDLLCIDEFDKVRDTPYGTEKKFGILDERYVMAVRMKNITIIASNKTPDEYPGYIYDRLRDGRMDMVEFTGQSARPGMEWS